MSVNISVSNKNNTCNDILQKLIKYNINCRSIDTMSIIDYSIEKGCLLTFDNNYSSKKSINKLWNIINSNDNYICSHLKIDGIFDGCIFDYIKCNNCPGNINK
uniref:Uncharacterized protein n=1 Tax=viral metagenome TaxID=1070528 RepID=A0A6C0LCT6_9ZZZZ